jgi:hypothetical protein
MYGEANAYVLGKDVFQVVKLDGNPLEERLMNKVIHKSWGEGEGTDLTENSRTII